MVASVCKNVFYIHCLNLRILLQRLSTVPLVSHSSEEHFVDIYKGEWRKFRDNYRTYDRVSTDISVVRMRMKWLCM